MIRIKRLGHAFDAFCYGFRLRPKTRDAFYYVGAALIFFASLAIEDSYRHRRSVTASRPAPEQTGINCVASYSDLENEIFNGLVSANNKASLLSQSCVTQMRTLGLLANYPREERDAVLARLLSPATHH
jgi:hypothetical protein